TFGAFLLFTCIEQKQAPRGITETSRLTFGMYLMHLLFLAPISNAIIAGDVANPLLPVWLAIPVIAILSYLCCLLTTKLLTYLPGSKWLVGA
ncbi:MAG: acyltransferase, partial [Bacteroidaceae bacterium]|nr:acyltransferase [Bacteroidaceae bacterium]